MEYEIVTSESELNAVIVALSACPRNDPLNPHVLDVETFPSPDTPYMPAKKAFEQPANDRFTALMAGVAISWAEDQAVYIPLRHTDENNLRFDSIVDSNEMEMWRRLNPVLTQWEWANHVERFDWGIVKRRGFYINYRYCSYVEAILTGRFFTIKGDWNGSDAGLKSLVAAEFGYQMRTFDEIARFTDGHHIERVPAETAAWYACDDAAWARKLHRKLYPEVVEKTPFLWNVEMTVSHLVEVMEENGIPFTREDCAKQLQKLQEFVPKAAEVIYAQVERQLGKRVIFDIGNPNKVRDIFFDLPPDGLGLPVQRRSRKTQKASTDAKAMDKLRKDFQVVHNVMTYRQLKKADTSFLATLPSYIHPLTNCIHSTFHQGGVPAGRFASSNPNSQNWSGTHLYTIKDGDEEIVLEINVKNSAEVGPDELLIIADYKQAEMWGACEVAQEDGMLSLIAQGYDVHTATASLMYHVSVHAVPDALRKKAKTRNFAMLYGETDEGAASKEGISVEEARKMRLEHERGLARVISHRKQIIDFGRRNGYIKTHFGRIVDLRQLYEHPDRNVQEKGDRLAYNAFMQGSFTGDMPKIAMARCMSQFRNDYFNYPGSYNCVHIPLIHNGHDALMFRLTPSVRGRPETIDLPGFVLKLKAAMEFHIPGFKLSARVDVKFGRKYGSMVDYKGQRMEEALDQLNNVERERQVANGNGNGSGDKSLILKLKLQVPPTNEQAVALKALLIQYPGNNVVALNYFSDSGSEESVMIGKYPTSLSLKDADRFGIVLPCQVLAEKPDEHMDFMAEAMDQI